MPSYKRLTSRTFRFVPGKGHTVTRQIGRPLRWWGLKLSQLCWGISIIVTNSITLLK